MVIAAVGVAVWAVVLPGIKATVASTTTSSTKPGSPTSSRTQQSRSSASRTSTSVATASSSGGSASGSSTYGAELSGQNETPVVSTTASGTIALTVAANGSSVHYVLKFSQVPGVTLARLHEGKAGASGATLLTIFGGPARTDVFSGVLTQGSFAAAQLVGPLKGKTVADLVALIKAGSVYLNVGTSSHPLGELRGQLK